MRPTPVAAPFLRRKGVVHSFVGLLLLCVAVVGLWQDIAWLAQPFYAWVWWGYILLLDGYSACKRGSSLLTTRLDHFLPICIWSVTFWFFFELINARIQNWYYVGVFPLNSSLVGALFAIVAFATVFMGIFQTVDALNATGWFRHWKGAQRRFPLGLTYLLQAIGLFLGSLAILFPYYLAPLIWGSFTLVVDPWNYRRGARSLLRDIERGDFGLITRILLAGLICGVVWESLNFFAPQKWIYTVRGLEGFKVFEMPLLGFLGFPALALDCMAGYALCSSWLLGNRSWEHSTDLSYQLTLSRKRPASLFWALALAQVFFWLAVSQLATPVNVASIQVELQDLGLTQDETRQLHTLGISRPRQLLRATEGTKKQSSICSSLHWTPNRLKEVRRRARLYTFKGIGLNHGRLLENVGVKAPEDLKRWQPETLHARLAALTPPLHLAPPRLDFVRVWILSARDQDVIQNGK